VVNIVTTNLRGESMLNIHTTLSRLNKRHSEVTNLVDLFYFTDEADNSISCDCNAPNVGAIAMHADGDMLLAGEGFTGLFDGGNCCVAQVSKVSRSNVVDEGFTTTLFDGGSIYTMGVQSDGKIIVGGYLGDHKAYGDSVWVTDNVSNSIARLNVDGTWDSVFDANVNNLVGSDAVNKVLVLSDDSILVAGRFDLNGAKLVKLNADGTPNTAFNAALLELAGLPSGMQAAFDVAVDSNGKIVLVGQNNNPADPFIIRLNSDGTKDMSFTPPTILMDACCYDCFIKTVAIQSDNKIVIGGIFDTIVDFNSVTLSVNAIARLNEDGSVDEGFFSDQELGLHWYDGDIDPIVFYFPYISTIKVQDDDKLIVAGDFNTYGTGLRNYLCRLSSDGVLDPSFGVANDFYGDNSSFYQEESQGNSYYTSIHDIYLVSSSEIWAGGYFIKPRKYYVKLNGSGKHTGVGGTYKMKTTGINDGHFDMYDGGNFFNTNLTQAFDTIHNNNADRDLSIPNTHSAGLYDMWASDSADSKGVAYRPTTFDATVEAGTEYFGEGSHYFTNMYPGMFVLAATGTSVGEFSITGNIGTDGDGIFAMDSFSLMSNGKPFSAFVKSVTKEDGSDEVAPTHIIIVPGGTSGVENLHVQGDDDNYEDQCVSGISGKNEIYVIVVAKKDGTLFTTNESKSLAQKFLDIINMSSAPSGFVQATRTCLPCRKPDGSLTCSKWTYFFADCPKNNMMCSGMSGGYVPAITVCNQRLF